MIIFITNNSINKEKLAKLQVYLHETNSGIVVVVEDIDAIKLERD